MFNIYLIFQCILKGKLQEFACLWKQTFLWWPLHNFSQLLGKGWLINNFSSTIHSIYSPTTGTWGPLRWSIMPSSSWVLVKGKSSAALFVFQTFLMGLLPDTFSVVKICLSRVQGIFNNFSKNIYCKFSQVHTKQWWIQKENKISWTFCRRTSCSCRQVLKKGGFINSKVF